MKYMTRIVAIIVAAITALPLAAQDKKDMFNPVNTSVTSQTIAPDARAAGLGDAGAATDPDVVSQYWNPAKYPFTISRAGVALNYTPWLRLLASAVMVKRLYSSMGTLSEATTASATTPPCRHRCVTSRSARFSSAPVSQVATT